MGKVSPDIRNRIYELVLTRREPFAISTSSLRTRFEMHRDEAKLGCRALLFGCKVINVECSQLFYPVDAFNSRSSGKRNSFEVLDAFTDRIGMVHAHALRVVLHYMGIDGFMWNGHGLSRLADSMLLHQVTEHSKTHTKCQFTIRVSVGKDYGTLSIGIKNGVVSLAGVIDGIDDVLALVSIPHIPYVWADHITRLRQTLLEMRHELMEAETDCAYVPDT